MLYREWIAESMVKVMEKDCKVLLLGQNVTTPHGVFGTTTEAFKRFPERCIEIPLSETMTTGACIGLAMEGYKPILVHTRADFSLFSFEHLINTAAKIPFLHGKPLPFVMRCIVGRGWGQGPVHSQSFHHLLAEVPGLQVVVATKGDLYHLKIEEAFANGRPSVIFEPRRLYQTEDTLAWEWTSWSTPDITLVAIGDMLIEAVEAQKILNTLRVKADVRIWEYISSPPVFPEPSLLLDIAPRRRQDGIIAPPFVPQGVSQVFEEAWYPDSNDVVEAACKILGVQPPARKAKDGIFVTVGSAF